MPTLRVYTSEEIFSMLDNAREPRNLALIHFLVSTGARISAFDHEMTLKHIKRMPNRCTTARLYASKIEEYWAFLTPQASRVMDTYHKHRRVSGEIFYNDIPVFAAVGPVSKQLGRNGARSAMHRIVSKSVAKHKQDYRYNV